jgi:tRNA(fMet)-specific endonuclease VapC
MVIRYLLDTNAWIHYLKGMAPLVARIRSTPAGEIAVCSVVRGELLHGARKYGNADAREARVIQTLAPFISLPYDDAAAHEYARIRDQLEREGQIIGPYDLQIAAIARSLDLILVSSNREFSRVKGLSVEDWSTVSPQEPPLSQTNPPA